MYNRHLRKEYCMEKIINKIKAEEILNFIDLKKVAYYLLDDNTTLVKEGVEPYYNVTKNEIVLNNKTTSPWFLIYRVL